MTLAFSEEITFYTNQFALNSKQLLICNILELNMKISLICVTGKFLFNFLFMLKEFRIIIITP